jgi:hypothetical protein
MVATDLILFVAGEPDSGVNDLHGGKTSSSGRLLGSVFPVGLLPKDSKSAPMAAGSGPTPTATAERSFPPAQVYCANVVLEVAERLARQVTVVDVNRVVGNQALVDRWVGPDDLLPILVRPDGSRLVGVDMFSPRTVRRFLDVR